MVVHFGIDASSGLIYQGGRTFGACVVWPSPVVTPASFVSTDEKEFKPAKIENGYSKLIFREDAFDPIARTRRGRFYLIDSQNPTQNWHVLAVPPVHTFPDEIVVNRPDLAIKKAHTYYPKSISTAISEVSSNQLLVVLGADRASTLWTVVDFETMHTGEELVTLKARQSFGVLPKVDWGVIPDYGRDNIRKAMQTLEDDYHIASPESVVDRASEAATRVLNVYLQTKEKEPQDSLHKTITEMSSLQKEDKKEVAKNAADIVRLLHGRTKYAVQRAHNARPVREQDAELSVQCIGVMLCDLGWGGWV